MELGKNISFSQGNQISYKFDFTPIVKNKTLIIDNVKIRPDHESLKINFGDGIVSSLQCNTSEHSISSIVHAYSDVTRRRVTMDKSASYVSFNCSSDSENMNVTRIYPTKVYNDTDNIRPRTFKNTNIVDVDFLSNTTRIKRIEEYAFYKCFSLLNANGLSSNDITYIGNNAFYACAKMSSLGFEDSVKYIGQFAFSNNSAQKSFSFPNALTVFYSFLDCSNLESLNLSNCTNFILDYGGNGILKGCNKLTSIILDNDKYKSITNGYDEYKTVIATPDGKTILGVSPYVTRLSNDDAINAIDCFSYCLKLTDISLKNCVDLSTHTMSSPFTNCTKLTCIDINNDVLKTITNGYDNLSTIVVTTDGKTLIGPSACNRKISVDSVVDAKNCGCFGCNLLEEVHFKNMQYGPGRMFLSCTELVSVDLPSLKQVPSTAFYGDNKLTNLKFPSVVEITNNPYVFTSKQLSCIELPMMHISDFADDTGKIKPAYSKFPFGANATCKFLLADGYILGNKTIVRT